MREENSQTKVLKVDLHSGMKVEDEKTLLQLVTHSDMREILTRTNSPNNNDIHTSQAVKTNKRYKVRTHKHTQAHTLKGM